MSNAGRANSDLSAKLRSLPSVDRVLSEPALREALARGPRGRVVEAIRAQLEQARAEITAGDDGDCSSEAVAQAAARSLEQQRQPSLRRVINATGVVLHTNLGRAPVSDAAAEAMAEAAAGYANLEFDLDSGERGSRADHLEALLQAVTGADYGVAVNNNAAALYLVMSAFCRGREVLVSRGEAVEIGGGFRIPDVIRQAGAELVEVGTTNRTRAADYADAVSDNTAAILRVHSSNFRIIGFTEQPALAELRQIADKQRIMLIDDVGSGCLLDTREFGLAYEPRPQDSVAAGADLTLFSGDKLLGGPQAGIIVGARREDLPRLSPRFHWLRSHPLMRALRLDKATIAGLAVTLQHYLDEEAVEAVPVWRMIAAEADALRARAEAWRSALGIGEVEASESPIGGGSLPGETRPTSVWSLEHPRASELAQRLRSAEPPIIARVERGRLLLDPRTVLPAEDEPLIAALQAIVNPPS